MKSYSTTGKRLFDLSLVLIAAPVWLGLLGALAILARLAIGSPIFFRQIRPGLRGQPFSLIKFRTMTSRRDERGELLPDAERLVPFGRWLRAWSLDELPELINVLRGEMSLVGPRPLLLQYLPLYSPRQARRHEVKPGLTGWAQVNGRNAISWEEKFELDLWYVENHSLAVDLKILLLTFVKILKREQVNSPGSATAPFFTGSSSASQVLK